MQIPYFDIHPVELFSMIREDTWANMSVGTTWQAEEGRVTIVKRSGDFMAHKTGDTRVWDCANTPMSAVDRLHWSAPEIWA